MTSERATRAVASALVLVAAFVFFAEPLPKGPVLLSFTRAHGVDLVDVVPLALVAVAAVLFRATRAPSRPRPAVGPTSAGDDRAAASPPAR